MIDYDAISRKNERELGTKLKSRRTQISRGSLYRNIFRKFELFRFAIIGDGDRGPFGIDQSDGNIDGDRFGKRCCCQRNQENDETKRTKNHGKPVLRRFLAILFSRA
jgi:hypothetical protein